MRVVRVLAPGPDGEGKETGTVETVIEAQRIAEKWGWCRAYRSHIDGANMVYDCLSVQLNYAWDRGRDLWVSDDRGGHGEPLTIPASNDQDDALRAGMRYLHQIAEMADSPMWCARCGRMLEPGTDAARTFDSAGERGIVCSDCGGSRPSRPGEGQL